MERDRLSRKLAVILHADVVGSTALVQMNETLAHERIQSAFHQFSATINAYGGITHELRGDALVAEFERASDAVAAALAFQAANTELNASLDDPVQPQMRIGISMGEVVIADNTITGAGVVLAQRLEQLAEPGKVCIQGAAHETVPQRLPFEYKSLGKQQVKGFEEPVGAYTVALKPGESIPAPEPASEAAPLTHKRPRNSSVALGSIVFLVLIGISLAWWQPWVQREEPASLERMTFPLPDEPSIVVLPFKNLSDDPKQEYFADGITEDLITDLSRISGLFVIARNSAFSYKGKPVKVRQVAEDLGVRFVIQGSVRRVDDTIRINAQLIDATTGGYLWAEHHDGPLTEIFTLQDKITRGIVTALELNLTVGEQQQQAQKETNSPEAYDAFLRGWDYYRLHTPDDFTKAIPYLENAIELDPNFGRAHAALAAIYSGIYIDGWAEGTGVSYDDAFKKIKHHLEEAMKNPTPLTHWVAAKQHEYFARFDEAMAEAAKAIALDPNDPNGYEAMGSLLVNQDRAAEGLELIEKAMRLDPQSDYLYEHGSAQFHLERYDEAAATLLRATRRNPRYERNYLLLAATYGYLGREEEGKASFTTFNNMYHDPTDKQRPFTLADLGDWATKDEAGQKRIREGLRKVEVPEGATGKPANLEFTDLISVPAGTFEVEGAIEIDAAEAKTLHDRGIVYIDSRGRGLYQRGHIPGATNLFFHQVWDSLGDLVDEDAEIVFYCVDPKCHLAAHSSAQALILGYTRVYYFAGGFSAWKNSGYPVEEITGDGDN
jgi:adenylate cyclase